jgi:hypothetical protein
LGASSDRDARGIVTDGLSVLGGEGLLPVLGAPAAGAGRVHGDDRDTGPVGHRGQAGAEFSGGDAGDDLSEAAPAAVLLAGLLPPRSAVTSFDIGLTAGRILDALSRRGTA